MTKLSLDFQTRCIGRYLIDMPGSMAVSGYAKVQDVDVDVKPMSQEAYQQEIALREMDLKSMKSALGYRFLYQDGEAQERGTRFFVHLGSRSEPSDTPRVIEAYKWDRNYRIRLKVKAWDYTHSAFRDEPSIKQMTVKNNVPEKTRLVLSLLESVRGRNDDEIPTEPGLCFFGGFLPGRADDSEEVSIQYIPRDHYDVTFKAMTDPRIREETTLLKRGGQTRDTVKSAGGEVIRYGTIDLQSMKADEWLVSGKTGAGLFGYVFALEANTTTSTRLAPFFSLDMSVGDANKDLSGNKIERASFTEGEAVALWDAISRTLRPRPNGF